MVLHVYDRSGKGTQGRSRRSGAARDRAEARLEEAVGLAEAIDLRVVERQVVSLPGFRAGTLLGPGKIEELAAYIRLGDIDVVVVDGALSPIQQRNLERTWKTKVIDRTGLILEIFGARAQTKEGTLQVELAHLVYQRSRLVRSWTHLERQRGGFGFMGGPGERQIEADRRLIDERVTRLRREIETVKKTRALHRRGRKRAPYLIAALVGYTNAGKSTLFNRLTGASVMAEDILFATLDPTMREVALPSGAAMILSDTVGFISDLPTTLIAAFRATLEEVLEADVIVHVRDISDPHSADHKADVEEVLRALWGDGAAANAPVIEVWNKADLLDPEARVAERNALARTPNALLLSAVTGEGCDDLLALLDRNVTCRRETVEFTVEHSDGAAMAWLYEKGEVLSRSDEAGHAVFQVRLDPADAARFKKRIGAS